MNRGCCYSATRIKIILGCRAHARAVLSRTCSSTLACYAAAIFVARCTPLISFGIYSTLDATPLAPLASPHRESTAKCLELVSDTNRSEPFDALLK